VPQPLRTARGVYAGDVKEFAVYTLSRIGLFVAAYAIVVGVYLLVTGGDSVPLLWPVVVAALVSSVASVTMLRRQRERFAASVEQRARRAAARNEAHREAVRRAEAAEVERTREA
jgi:mannitol-specific phosphotransferase system IIBC component